MGNSKKGGPSKGMASLGRKIPADISEENIAVINEDYEDYLVFSDIDVTDVRYSGEDVNEPDEMNDEEIVEYLIYIGATERYIESNKE